MQPSLSAAATLSGSSSVVSWKRRHTVFSLNSSLCCLSSSERRFSVFIGLSIYDSLSLESRDLFRCIVQKLHHDILGILPKPRGAAPYLARRFGKLRRKAIGRDFRSIVNREDARAERSNRVDGIRDDEVAGRQLAVDANITIKNNYYFNE